MLSLFVNSLALSLTPCLVWVGLFAARRRLCPGRGSRTFLIATSAGVVAAVAIALLEQFTNWISREVLELWLLPASVLLVLAVLVWVWWPAGEDRGLPPWGTVAVAMVAGLVCVLQLPDVFALVAAIVPYGASALTSDALANLSGYLLGVATTALTAWAAYRASIGAGRRVTQIATSVVLLLLGASQLVALTRVMLVRGLVDPPSWVFNAVVVGVNNQWLVTVGLAVAALLPVGSALVAQRASRTPPANPAESRLRRAGVLTRRRFIGLAGVGLGVAAATMTVGRAMADTEPTLSAPEPLSTDAHDVWVAIPAIDDGHLHRFAYDAKDGTEVRFIAIRKSTNSFVAALDACNICGPAGYYEKDGRVICRMCGVAMNITTIGFKGGCNPIPIAYTVAEGRLTVARKVLEANTKVFA